MNCPHCGEHIEPKSRKLRAVSSVSIENMTTAQLYEYRKATAPYEDLKFWLGRPSINGTLAVRMAALAPLAQQPGKRKEFYRQFTALQDEWRRGTNSRKAQRRKVAA